MEHVCSNCHTTFQMTHEHRSPLAWGLGLRGIYTTNYSRAIEHFNIVVCPKCAHAEADARLRVFGLFTPQQFKVVVVAVLLVLAAAGICDLFWSNR